MQEWFFSYIQLLEDRNISKNAEMKPMKYNYKERKLKKKFMGKYTVLYRTYEVHLY